MSRSDAYDEGCSCQTFGGAIEERRTHALIVAIDSKFDCAPFHISGLDRDPNVWSRSSGAPIELHTPRVSIYKML
ncbi:Hypothetical predicted protein [Olea europaea subsp. europaea]|uniref:Uncharacterized protein n=1 Tax=Olea europaea subsp. europaea TaxID=158383 RepID=A0A8S0S1X3_OLEEU|nr:Hypothetical predicted protein [Olea europaea subsp. europaea]